MLESGRGATGHATGPTGHGRRGWQCDSPRRKVEAEQAPAGFQGGEPQRQWLERTRRLAADAGYGRTSLRNFNRHFPLGGCFLSCLATGCPLGGERGLPSFCRNAVAIVLAQGSRSLCLCSERQWRLRNGRPPYLATACGRATAGMAGVVAKARSERGDYSNGKTWRIVRLPRFAYSLAGSTPSSLRGCGERQALWNPTYRTGHGRLD